MLKYWRSNILCIINDDVFGHKLKSCLSTGYSTRYNRGFNGSHTKSFERARGLKMSNIYSIGYCELAEIRVWKIQDHLDLVPGGPVSGNAAIYQAVIVLQRKRNATQRCGEMLFSSTDSLHLSPF